VDAGSQQAEAIAIIPEFTVLAFALAALLLGLITREPEIGDLAINFISIILEAMPFMMVGAIIGGIISIRRPTPIDLKPENPRGNSGPAMAPANSREPTMLDLVSDPEEFEGSNANLEGVVHKDKRLPTGSFFRYRLPMVCCAADASPIGVIVKWPESGKLNKGTWVKVHGKVGFTVFEGEDYPAISAAKVVKTAPPKNRFIIPQ
jgi:hypothetical protein